MMKMLHEQAGPVLFNPDFFELRYSGAIGKSVKTLKPVVRFPDGKVKLGFDIGTRGNGVDDARWPADLSVDIVKSEGDEDETQRIDT
jgi:hypothetical protein